jgi:hypothetical protein
MSGFIESQACRNNIAYKVGEEMKLYEVLLADKRNVKVAADDWQEIGDQVTFFSNDQATSSFDKFAVVGVNVLSSDYGGDFGRVEPYTEPDPLDF